MRFESECSIARNYIGSEMCRGGSRLEKTLWQVIVEFRMIWFAAVSVARLSLVMLRGSLFCCRCSFRFKMNGMRNKKTGDVRTWDWIKNYDIEKISVCVHFMDFRWCYLTVANWDFFLFDANTIDIEKTCIIGIN